MFNGKTRLEPNGLVVKVKFCQKGQNFSCL